MSENNVKYQNQSELGEPHFQQIVGLVMKALAVGMAVASLVMGFVLDAVDIGTQITLLSLGLAALAISSLQKE